MGFGFSAGLMFVGIIVPSLIILMLKLMKPFDEKMTRLTSDLAEMFAKSHKLEDEIRQRLGAIGYEF
jgi:hypothetical protein